MRITVCADCGRTFAAHRSTARFCSVTCRSRSHRRTDRGGADALLEQADFAYRAIREGADPYLTLSLLIWPSETAEDARRLLGVAA